MRPLALLLLAATAHADPPWTAALDRPWVLHSGWPGGMPLTLVRPDAAGPDDWVGVVFASDGAIRWSPARAVDPSGGCSGAFDHLDGSWRIEAGVVQITLVEHNRAGERYLSQYRLAEATASALQLVVRPADGR